MSATSRHPRCRTSPPDRPRVARHETTDEPRGARVPGSRLSPAEVAWPSAKTAPLRARWCGRHSRGPVGGDGPVAEEPLCRYQDPLHDEKRRGVACRTPGGRSGSHRRRAGSCSGRRGGRRDGVEATWSRGREGSPSCRQRVAPRLARLGGSPGQSRRPGDRSRLITSASQPPRTSVPRPVGPRLDSQELRRPARQPSPLRYGHREGANGRR